MGRRLRSRFYQSLQDRVIELGGGHNAHLHLDRAGTLDALNVNGDEDSWATTLEKKHSLIEVVHHSDFYSESSIKTRVGDYLEIMADLGITIADTFVDVTTDGVGQKALNALTEVKTALSNRIELRLGAYNPLGFTQASTVASQLIRSSLEQCSFVGGLPERDELFRYPDHIGFEDSCRLMYDLAAEAELELHLHVDQRNDPLQNETERCLAALEKRLEASLNNKPAVSLWLIHVVSPSRYDEPRFTDLLEKLLAYNVGVVCCPSAALSMRQLRGRKSPTSNSIARTLDMAAKGIPVRVGCDNIDDAASPAGTPDLVEELINLANAERYYDIEFLATIGAGKAISTSMREQLSEHLQANQQHCVAMQEDYI